MIKKKTDYMEAKQQALKKKTVGQWGNQKGNFKKTSRQTAMKTQPYKIYGTWQKKFLALPKKQNKPKKKKIKKKILNNLTSQLKQLEKEEQRKPKAAEGRKT